MVYDSTLWWVHAQAGALGGYDAPFHVVANVKP
jgi:hypothetical protein